MLLFGGWLFLGFCLLSFRLVIRLPLRRFRLVSLLLLLLGVCLFLLFLSVGFLSGGCLICARSSLLVGLLLGLLCFLVGRLVWMEGVWLVG